MLKSKVSGSRAFVTINRSIYCWKCRMKTSAAARERSALVTSPVLVDSSDRHGDGSLAGMAQSIPDVLWHLLLNCVRRLSLPGLWQWVHDGRSLGLLESSTGALSVTSQPVLLRWPHHPWTSLLLPPQVILCLYLVMTGAQVPPTPVRLKVTRVIRPRTETSSKVSTWCRTRRASVRTPTKPLPCKKRLRPRRSWPPLRKGSTFAVSLRLCCLTTKAGPWRPQRCRNHFGHRKESSAWSDKYVNALWLCTFTVKVHVYALWLWTSQWLLTSENPRLRVILSLHVLSPGVPEYWAADSFMH